jgi:hypothetical protein
MKNWSRLIGIALIGFCFSCSDGGDTEGIFIFPTTYDFAESQHGWEADFTDYPAALQDTTPYDTVYRWDFAYTQAPASAGGRGAIKVSGNNESGDLFMFIKKKVTGFQPNTDYTVVFEVELASDAPTGGSVILKAGAANIEPKKIIEGNSFSLNLDKGDALTAGEDVIVLGDIGVNNSVTPYALVTKSSASSNTPFHVLSNSKGEIWLLVGTDSGFRDYTTVYYTKVSAVFSGSR